MASMTEQNCEWCKKTFMARTADVNRGWAKFCCKSCKAMKQEKRTGQFKKLQTNRTDDAHESAMESSTVGWDEGGWLGELNVAL